ncbi:MAG: DUF4340 domain-containing protein [Anaerolineaceae bacterium]|nr:DUF4340 domain-containing protein [Anaerolineaceae bacterium]
MNRRTFFILLVIFAALVVVTIVQEQQLQQDFTNSISEMNLLRVFPGLAVLDIQALRLSSPAENQSFILSRDTSGQWIAPDSSGTLDTNAATTIARSIVLLTYQRTIMPENDDLSVYGFGEQASFAVEILLTNGDGHALAVGGLNSTGSGYYALVDNDPEIYLVDRGALDFLITQLRTPPIT